ncbi:MAG: hypothetical protein GHCLOJNM_04076 [bacterium]|nr:hypothetical protein [bacterium]
MRGKNVSMLLVLAWGVTTLFGNLSGVAAGDDPIAEAESPVPTPHPNGKARIEALASVHDFGVLRASEIKPITVVFEFQNVGTEPLKLLRVHPSCECSAAVPSASDFAPGAKGTLTAHVEPKGISGRQDISILVYTNDPTRPVEEFKVTGTALADWRVIPLVLNFGKVGKGETSTKDISVSSHYREKDTVHRITRLVVEGAGIRAATSEPVLNEHPPEIEGAYEIERPVEVTLSVGDKQGEGKGRLLIATDDPKNPTHVVEIEWTVEGDLASSPEKLFLARTAKRAVSRDMAIESRAGTPFEILGIEVSGTKGSSDLEITEKEITPARKVYSVSANFLPASGDEKRTGTVRFKTNRKDQPVVEIPYTATARR